MKPQQPQNQQSVEDENPQSPTRPVERTTVERPREIGGRKTGLEPTRYGDWEKNGRCIDF